MKSLVRAAALPAILAVVASVALAVALTAVPDKGGLEVNLWLLSIGAVSMWFFWRLAAGSLPSTRGSAFDAVRDRETVAPSRIDDLLETEAILLDAEWNRGGTEHRLRPLVRRIARARLIDKFQVDLEIQPDEARRILGEELWALAGPSQRATEQAAEPAADAGTRRRQPGIPREKIRRTIELLEAL